MHLGSCGACKMAWICDCAGGREETTWWTCSVSRLVFLICLHVSLVFFWKHPLPLLRLRAAVFVNLVAMRAAMSDSSNTGVKLTDSNLQMLQRANYLFHSAHNWCLAALLLMCQFSLQRWSVISLLKTNLIILYLRACDWSFGKRKSTLAHTSKVPQVTCVHISVLPAGK